MGKTIIVLRHGFADNQGNLLPQGKDLASLVGEKLSVLYPGVIWEVWSSLQKRAFDTAECIIEKINTSRPVSTTSALNMYEDVYHTFNLIERSEAEYILLVTHQSNIVEMYKQENKKIPVISYCEGVVMNQDASQFETFKIENN